MTVCIIGSKAMALRGLDREVNDLDIIATYDDAVAYIKSIASKIISLYPSNEGKKIVSKIVGHDGKTIMVEAELAWESSTAEEFLNIAKSVDSISQEDGSIVPPIYMLHLLKHSHRFRRNSPHFHKTMNDLMYLKHVAKYPTDIALLNRLLKFLERREKETYDYKKISLKKDKEDFFANDGVKYFYDHDSIHQAMVKTACLVKPAYKFFAKEGEQVLSSRELFESSDPLIKNRAVLEESYVLALERCLIPNDFKIDPKKAFDIALMKVCTTITSGWFREYAYANYYQVQSMYSVKYVTAFHEALKEGIVYEV